MRVNADSLLIRAAATSTSGTLNDLTTDLIMANNNNNITITAQHTDINIAKANIQPYLQDVLKWTKDNDLLLNTDKTTCTLLTPDPAEYNKQLGHQIDNTTLPMTTHPKILGLTLDPKLTYNRHIDLAATKARKTINILKVLTSTKCNNIKKPYSPHTKPLPDPYSSMLLPYGHPMHPRQTTDSTKHCS